MYTKEQREKAAVWLFNNCDGHGIYSYPKTAKYYFAAVGKVAMWQAHSVEETMDIMRRRGLGGTLAPTKETVCYGYEMAEAVLGAALSDEEEADYQSRYGHVSGRGSRFRNCIAAIAGKVDA